MNDEKINGNKSTDKNTSTSDKNAVNTGKNSKNKTKNKKKNNRATGFILCILVFIIISGTALIIYMGRDLFDNGKEEPDTTNNVTQEQTTKPIIKDFVGLRDVKGTISGVDAYIYGISLCIKGEIQINDVNDTNNTNDTTDTTDTLPQDQETETTNNYSVTDSDIYEKMSFIIRRAYTNEDGSIADDYREFPAYFQTEGDVITFSSYDKINNGLCLELRDEEEYVLVLKAVRADGVEEIYSLSFEDTVGELKYYTLTKNSENYLVDMKNMKSADGISYCAIDIEKTSLPEDVYDIVLDPGHGGNDPGAVNGDYCESVTMLDYAKDIKAEFEKLGYKVLLTRDGSESSDEWMAYTMYDENGRVNVAAGSNAKYCFSLHLNSNEVKLSSGGIQIYHSCRADKSIAKHIVDTIVEKTGTHYSPMSAFKEVDGVYYRAYSEADISENKAGAQKNGYEPYNITTDTDYYFMIRELGGVATNAYVDGRNPKYGSNNFRNSRNGVETLICELGFISVDEDLEHILNNKELYVKAIVEGFETWRNIDE